MAEDEDPFNPNAYMLAMIAARSALADPEKSQRGEVLLSVETTGVGDTELVNFISENFALWMKYMHLMTGREQDILLSIFLLGQTQRGLGRLFGASQTQISTDWRQSVDKLSLFITCGGLPCEEYMHFILLMADQDLIVATIVARYQELKSFKAVADQLGIRREDVRLKITRTADNLMDSTDPAERGLGAYFKSMILLANPDGTGLSRVERKKPRLISRADPDNFGDFRIHLEDFEIEKFFTLKSSLYQSEETVEL
jgi:hypothetical protein